MRNSQSKLSKELDLQTNLQRQRSRTFGLLGLLTSKQIAIIDKVSYLDINDERKQYGTSSSDDELSDSVAKLGAEELRKLQNEANLVERRLLQAYDFKIKKRGQGKDLKFETAKVRN